MSSLADPNPLDIERICLDRRGVTGAIPSQVWILLIWQWHLRRSLHLLVVLLDHLRVDLNLRWCQSRRGHKFEGCVADQFSGEPKEGLFEVVVRLCGDVVVLQVLLAVEGDCLGLDFALLHIDFVAAQDDGNVLTNTNQVTWKFVLVRCKVAENPAVLTMPVGNILVGDSGCDIEHNDTALAVDVVAISKATELLLSCSIPNVEEDLSEVLSWY